ncbi:MAG TPA: hypothetical protein VKF16_01835 [Candidatus Dormibacteraeota bacterium]|nr:hypothetical protein [Candidatus Dormibacteraeota bacterium]
MRSLSELTGQNLVWNVQAGSAGIPDQAQQSYVLFMGTEPVVQAQTIWQRNDHFDVIMESGEGTYQVHMDLTGPKRSSVVWKLGETASAAAFELVSESIITCTGWINTASQRTLAWAPTHEMGGEYAIFVPGGPRLITLAAAASLHIGGNPGAMTLAPEMAGDAELAPLVALGLAIANEQVRLLHRAVTPGGPGQQFQPTPEQLKQMEDVFKLLGLKVRPT